jgi:hypothetical protein
MVMVKLTFKPSTINFQRLSCIKFRSKLILRLFQNVSDDDLALAEPSYTATAIPPM